MRRSFKKAVAFALATVTVVANFGVSAPATAAEYDAVKDVLPAEYHSYEEFNGGAFFSTRTEVKKSDTESKWYVDELVYVDKNGEKSTMEVKNTDGTYKYTYVSHVSDECIAMVRDDSTYSLYFADGTWFGDGAERYEDIFVLDDGNYLVSNDGACNVVDKTGKVIAKNIFAPIDVEYSYWWPYAEIGDYILLGREYYDNDEDIHEIKLFDKNYKEVTTIDFDGYEARVLRSTYIALKDEKNVIFYDKNLKKLDYVYKRDIVTNPSASTDGEPVLTDYRISGVWGLYDYNGKRDVIEIQVECTYEDALGEQSFDYEIVYLDMKTFAVIDENDISTSSGDAEGVIYNTDVTYKYDNSVIQFYNGTTKVANMDSLSEYIVAKKSLAENAYVSLGTFTGYNGDLYLDITIYNEDGSEEYYTLVLAKKDGFDLQKATIIDKGISSHSSYLGGVIYFDDSTFLFNGKTYDENTMLRTYWRYNFEIGKSWVEYYSLQTTNDDAITCTLYDKNHVEVAKLTEEIVWVTDNGLIITAKDIIEDGLSNRYWGCKYVKKTLVSNEDVLDELENIVEGESVEVTVKKNDPIKATIFETIKGKDVNVVVTIENGMKWKINGKNVKNDKLIDIDLTVDIVKDVVPAAAIDNIKLKGERIELSLAHTGDFGFQAELTMNVKAENAGKFANRFFYNPETKELEFQEAVKVDANGDAAFTYTHASDYVIILSDVAYDVATPETADTANVGMLMAFLAVAAGTVVFVQKKRVSVK